MSETEVYLRWDGVYIPEGRHERTSATKVWRNSAALGDCKNARAPDRGLPRWARVMPAAQPHAGTVLRQQRAQVSIISTTTQFAPGQEWVWIKAKIRDIGKVGSLVLQIRDRNNTLVYTERLSRRQVWRLPPGTQPPPNDVPPLRHVPDEPPANAKARAELEWAHPAGSPYTVTILTAWFARDGANSIHGPPALTADPIPPARNPDYDANSVPAVGVVDQTNVAIASMSLELVPWSELYEASTGLSAARAPGEAGENQTKWVQYKLNELGWFAGKLDGDADDPDLERAIIRYRQSNKELYRPLFAASQDPIDTLYELTKVGIDTQINPGLIQELEADTAGLPSFDTPSVFTGAAAEGKLYVHAERSCQDAATEFANEPLAAGVTIKYEKEQEWLSAPRFPLRAKVLVTDSRGAAVWAPGASQSIEVLWSWQDRAETTNGLPVGNNTTKQYIEDTHALLGGAVRSQYHNARRVVGGQITDIQQVNKAIVFEDADGPLTPVGAGALTTGGLLFFCPSKIAGDNYKLTANIIGHQAETGWMTLWRRLRITGHVSWGGAPTDVWGEVARRYAHAYVELVAPAPQTMADVADDPLKDAFRAAAKMDDWGDDEWSDDAWYPVALPEDLAPGTTTEQMQQRLVDILNDEDHAYDAWVKGEELIEVIPKIAARYLEAKLLIERKWKNGIDEELAPGRREDPVLKGGWEHYLRELNRIIETAPNAPPKGLGFAEKLRWEKTESVLASFRALAQRRQIEPWDSTAIVASAIRSKVHGLTAPLIQGTQQTIHLELERILGPGIVVLEFAAHLPKAGMVLNRSYGSQMIGGGKVIINRGAYGTYDRVHLFAHELGHALFLKHYKNATGQEPLDHDQSDDNCMMSYVYDPQSLPAAGSDISNGHHYAPGQFNPQFCGKCNLKLRGWNIRAGNLPLRST